MILVQPLHYGRDETDLELLARSFSKQVQRLFADLVKRNKNFVSRQKIFISPLSKIVKMIEPIERLQRCLVAFGSDAGRSTHDLDWKKQYTNHLSRQDL
jgi:hypothetical protein